MSIHHRRSLRLQGYDYSKEGYYFITICAQDRAYLFGEIVEGDMVLNVAGEMLIYWHDELKNKFKHIINHEMVIMPNHIHFIVQIMEPVGADLCVCPHDTGVCPHGPHDTGVCPHDACTCPNDACIFPHNSNRRADRQVPNKRADTQVRPYVGDIVQWYKTMTTNAYIKMVKKGTYPPLNKRIWQRNYYEHIIRDNEDYHRIATYIINNPQTWDCDVLSQDTNT